MILTQDAKGRITISGLIGSNTLQKSRDGGATWVDVANCNIVGGSFVDVRPGYNWRLMDLPNSEPPDALGQVWTRNPTFTYSGYSFGFGCRIGINYDETQVTGCPAIYNVTVDGVSIARHDPATGTAAEGGFTIVTGKDFDTFATRTVSIEAWVPDGNYIYTDFRAYLGDTITYRYGSSTASIVWKIDRAGAVREMVDCLCVWHPSVDVYALNYLRSPFASSTWPHCHSALATYAVLYQMSPDARLVARADAELDYLLGHSGSRSPNIIDTDIHESSPYLDAGRTLSAVMGCYMAWGDPRYLRAAAEGVKYWLEEVYCLYYQGRRVWNQPGYNHTSKLIGGIARTVSNPDLLTLDGGAYAYLHLSNNPDLALDLQYNIGVSLQCAGPPPVGFYRINPNGSLSYNGGGEGGDRGYGIFELGDLFYVDSLTGGGYRSELNRVLDWMSETPLDEPFEWYDSMHFEGNIQTARLFVALMRGDDVTDNVISQLLYSPAGLGYTFATDYDGSFWSTNNQELYMVLGCKKPNTALITPDAAPANYPIFPLLNITRQNWWELFPDHRWTATGTMIPYRLKATNVGPTSFTLSFSVAPGASAYRVYRNGVRWPDASTTFAATTIPVTGITSGDSWSVASVVSGVEGGASTPLVVIYDDSLRAGILTSNTSLTGTTLNGYLSAVDTVSSTTLSEATFATPPLAADNPSCVTTLEAGNLSALLEAGNLEATSEISEGDLNEEPLIRAENVEAYSSLTEGDLVPELSGSGSIRSPSGTVKVLDWQGQEIKVINL